MVRKSRPANKNLVHFAYKAIHRHLIKQESCSNTLKCVKSCSFDTKKLLSFGFCFFVDDVIRGSGLCIFECRHKALVAKSHFYSSFYWQRGFIRAFRAVFPKLLRTVTRIKEGFTSYYPQYFAVTGHNTDEHCGFGSTVPLEKSHVIPCGLFAPSWVNTALEDLIDLLAFNDKKLRPKFKLIR